MDNHSSNPLDQLRDIVLPDSGVGLWPLAPGWWCLLVILAATLVSITVWRTVGKTFRHKRVVSRLALAQVDTFCAACLSPPASAENIQRYLQQANDIFKRLMQADPQLASLSSLSGSRWVQWLHTVNPASDYANMYGDNLYAPTCHQQIDAQDLHQWTRQTVLILSRPNKTLYRKREALP